MRWLKHVSRRIERAESSVELWSVLYLGVLIYAFTIVFITLLFVSAPFLIESGNRLVFGAGILAYNYGYLLNNCHQLPQRSLFLNGMQLPVCSRCMGMYFGSIMGVLTPFYFKTRNRFITSIWFAGLLMAPLVLDGISQTIFTMRESSNTMRFATGVLFGAGMMYYITGRILHYASRVGLDYRRVKGTSKIVSILFTVLVIMLSLLAGFTHTSRREALEILGQKHPESGITSSTYIPPNALNTITRDPFLSAYNDTVLDDLTLLRNLGRDGYWLFTEGEATGGGKTVYYSSRNTVRYYVNVRDGGIHVLM
jgi:uncharacterized membrane protein